MAISLLPWPSHGVNYVPPRIVGVNPRGPRRSTGTDIPIYSRQPLAISHNHCWSMCGFSILKAQAGARR